MVAPESAIDPEDDQGHIDRHRKDEKGNRVEERLVAQCDGRLFDLVDWYGDPQQLVASVAGRDLDDPANIAAIGDVVDKVPGSAVLPIRREQPGSDRILQIGQLRLLSSASIARTRL